MYSHLTKSNALRISSLKKEGVGLPFVQPMGKVPDVHEVVMNISPLDKDTLGIGNKGIHVRFKPIREHICNGMNKANGPIVRDPLRTLLLGQECDISRVEPMEVCRMKGVKMMNDWHDVALYDTPSFLKECTGEAIRPGCFVTWHVIDGLLDLFLRDGVVKFMQVVNLQVDFIPIKIFGTPVSLPPPSMMLEKCSCMIFSLVWWSVTQPCPCMSLSM